MKVAAIVGLLMLLASGLDQKVDLGISQPVHLGCERHHVNLYVVNTMPFVTPAAAGQRIVVSSQSSAEFVAGLERLRGLVRITDRKTALQFVRLRTSPATWYMWRDGSREMEIVAASRARSLPSFGLPDRDSGKWAKDADGWGGILPDDVYRVAGFSPPEVEKEPGGFAITRWIYSESKPDGRLILKVREVVEEDGRYQCSIVTTMDPGRVNQSLDPGQLMLPVFM